MVGPDDPLRPCQILHRFSRMGEFPVNDSRRMQCSGVKHHVLRAEIAVHQNRAAADLVRR